MAQKFADSPGPISLAQAAPFRLGEVQVHPATRQVTGQGVSETLEPRVMQVLVALAEAGGAILSHDELIRRCWGGRIVGENAIHRAVSRVREVAAHVGRGSFRVETITKVGYRIVEAGAAPAPEKLRPEQVFEPARAKLPRRSFMAVAVGLAAAAGAGIIFQVLRPGGGTRSQAARTLYEKGMDAQQQAVPEQDKQAIAFFRQAVAADPDYAEAWGALALAYRSRLFEASAAERADILRRCRSAAERAVALDPDNPDGRVALILTRASYRNWAAIEADCRRLLAEGLRHALVQGVLGSVLTEVGRNREAVEPFRAQVAGDPYRPLARLGLAGAYGAVGRVHEADATLEAALKLWPNHPDLWFTRFYGLAYSGRPAAAIAFASDPEARPFGIPEAAFESAIASARAVATRSEADVDAVMKARLPQVARGASSPGLLAQFCAAVGRKEIAFALLDTYYLGGSTLAPTRPAPGPLDRRNTAFLFVDPLTLLHSDKRFAVLTQKIGLEAYWRSSRTFPDYRRRSM